MEDKTKEQLVAELAELRAQVTELKTVEIECKRAEEEAQRRASQAALIYDVGQRVSAKLELETLLSEVATAIRDAFDYYGVMLLLLDKENGILNLQAVAGSYMGSLPQDIQLAVGQGMVGGAAASGETQISGDVSQDPNFVRVAEEKTQSELSVPIKSGQTVIGVLDLQSDELDSFDEIDVEAMEALSGQIANAIENARLFEEARIHAEEQAVLNEMGQALTVCLNVEEVMVEAYRGITRLMDITDFTVGLYDPEKHEITFIFSTTESGIDEQIDVLSADQGLSGYIVRNRTGVLFEDNVRARQEAMGVPLVGEESQSWLGVPMIVGDRVLGVMFVQNYSKPRVYNRHTQGLLTSVANQMAIALQNARLFEQVQRRVREVQMLQSVAIAAASGGVRFEKTLQSTAEALGDEYGEVHIGIALLDRETNRLHRLANSGSLPTGEFPKEGIPVGEGVIGWVVRNAEPALIPDVRADSRYVGVLSGTRTELCVPLIADGQVIGIINIESHHVNAFTQDDMQLLLALADSLAVLVERARLFDNMEKMVKERTAKLRESMEEREQLQVDIIEAQKQSLRELSTPVIPIMNIPGMGTIIAMPLIGSIDSMRARDITRALLGGIRKHQAKVVILDITGVPIVGSGVASHLNKTIQAARLKGARTILTGISDVVAETIVDLGIDWSGIKTLRDLQTGLIVALNGMGIKLIVPGSR
ncbi:MAG: GAF domain-containing protein [Chloroflexi bacterium]|nr:GAF domain-containing protein [Chloroflexota bacterium]